MGYRLVTHPVTNPQFPLVNLPSFPPLLRNPKLRKSELLIIWLVSGTINVIKGEFPPERTTRKSQTHFNTYFTKKGWNISTNINNWNKGSQWPLPRSTSCTTRMHSLPWLKIRPRNPPLRSVRKCPPPCFVCLSWHPLGRSPRQVAQSSTLALPCAQAL